MGFHMLAVFDKATARAPTGLEPIGVILDEEVRARAAPSDTPSVFPSEAEVHTKDKQLDDTLQHCSDACGEAKPTKQTLGRGNGFVFQAGPYCSYASRDGISVLFAGEVASWPDIDCIAAAHDAFMRDDPPPERNDAHWLLDFYSTFLPSGLVDIEDEALASLARVKGEFSFLLYDEHQQRVLAARDASGARPLFWGVNPEGQLMFGSELSDLDGCEPSATNFPPGALYASRGNVLAEEPGDLGWVITGEQWPGSLLAFMKSRSHPGYRQVTAVPRVNSSGCLCGAVYRVESQNRLAAL